MRAIVLLGLAAFATSIAACGSKTNSPLECAAPQTACGDVCADLATDGKHCGACGHDCLGGACVSGVCKTATLFTSATGAPYGIAVDDQNVYFTTVKEGSVYRCPKRGCAEAITTMAKGLASPRDVKSDGKNVYFTTLSSIASCPVTGCPPAGPTTFAAGQNAPSTIVLTGDRVWWTNHGSGAGGDAVLWCPIAGCGAGPTVFAAKQSAAEGLAVDGARVFWTLAYTPGGSVASCAMGDTCAAPTTLATGLDIPQSIASDGKNVYWTNFSGLSAMFCPVAGCGGKPMLLAAGAGWYDGIVLDDAFVYFTGGDGTGDALLRCAKSGCAGGPTVLAKGETKPGKIAVDATAIYWTASYTGAVSRVAK